MNKNSINKNKVQGIEAEFQDIALELKKMDFSEDSNKDKVYSKLMENVKESDSMKKARLIKRCCAAAVIILVSGVCVSQNTYAKEALGELINKISLGSVTIFHEDLGGRNLDDYKVLYDANGNEVDKETIKKGGTFYAKNGEEIKVEGDNHVEPEKLIITDANETNNYTCFDVKLPSYMPEGYKFKQAEFYLNKDGSAPKDSKYAWLVFVNEKSGKEFYIQERYDCEETRTTESTTGSLEKIKINGVDAALTSGRNVDWVKDGTIYALMGQDLNRDEVIEVAESIK